MPKDPAAAKVDAALHGLLHSSHTGEKLAALRALVDYWYGPIGPEDGIPTSELAGLALPRPLLEWYRWAGRRDEIMSGQNFMYRPDQPERPYARLEIDADDRVVFHVENQACYFWSTLRDGEDPPVFGRDAGNAPWIAEQVTLSEHLILNCISEIVMDLEYGACAVSLGEQKLNAIAEHVPALAIGPWRWCDMHFHAGGGAFMTASPIGEEDGRRTFSVWLAARREGVLDFLKPFIGDEWEHVSL